MLRQLASEMKQITRDINQLEMKQNGNKWLMNERRFSTPLEPFHDILRPIRRKIIECWYDIFTIALLCIPF